MEILRLVDQYSHQFCMKHLQRIWPNLPCLDCIPETNMIENGCIFTARYPIQFTGDLARGTTDAVVLPQNEEDAALIYNLQPYMPSQVCRLSMNGKEILVFCAACIRFEKLSVKDCKFEVRKLLHSGGVSFFIIANKPPSD